MGIRNDEPDDKITTIAVTVRLMKKLFELKDYGETYEQTIWRIINK